MSNTPFICIIFYFIVLHMDVPMIRRRIDPDDPDQCDELLLCLINTLSKYSNTNPRAFGVKDFSILFFKSEIHTFFPPKLCILYLFNINVFFFSLSLNLCYLYYVHIMEKSFTFHQNSACQFFFSFGLEKVFDGLLDLQIN